MTAISLRAYNREIEAMVDRGQNDDAITHCKYILKYFPKHVGTYRLLGKAFLESHHYSEAADILQRVLSVVPDDFISNIGMSIIREDEGNMDAAIWHMERAFEVQPSNTAVQGELRRLYGLRDGIEPPKVRLTRGALVRMYAKSDLYPQAIAELLAALAEDPQRVDLEIILAQMYYKSGKKIEATEICSRLISKLPYCLEANKLLAEILPTTSRAEEAKVFSQHLASLDPYYGHLSSTITLVDDVPDNAVTLERLEAVSDDTRIQPLSTTVPATVESTQPDAIPEWLPKTQEAAPIKIPFQVAESMPAAEQPFPAEQVEVNKETPPMSQDASVPPMDEQIPDWMREAGWSHSEDNPPAETPLSQSESEAGKENEDIAPAELPDWLKSMAPAEDQESPVEKQQDEEKLGILNTIFPGESGEETNGTNEEETAFESTGGSVTKLFSEESIREAEKLSPPAVSVNTNTSEAVTPPTEEKAEQLPDWLAETEASKAESPEAAEEPQAVEMSAPQPAQESEPESNENQTAPDWLEALARETPPTPEEASPTPAMPGEEPQNDWIKGILAEKEEDETGYADDYKRVSTKQLEEEASAALPSENMPDWLRQQPATPEAEPVQTKDASSLQPTEPRPRTHPIQPQAEPPEYLQQQAETPQQYLEPVQSAPEIPEALPQEQPATEQASETSKKEELPDWLQELEGNQPKQQTVQPAMETPNIDPSLKEWLDTLDAEKEAMAKAASEAETSHMSAGKPTEPVSETSVTPKTAPQPAEILPEVKAGVTAAYQPEEEETAAPNMPTPAPVETQPSPVTSPRPAIPSASRAHEISQTPAPSKSAGGKRRPTTSIIPDEVLAQARSALTAEKTEQAATLYGQLIRANEKLDDIVHDLQDASHQHPLDVSIWQTLGDCYAKNKQLQEALNAYTKAEELLR